MKFVDARKYRKNVNALYKSAFPVEERAPILFLYHRLRTGKAHFYAVTEQEQFIGLVYTICFRKIVYVFYLAIEEPHRGQGYGSRILQVLKKRYKGYTLILNIEDPHNQNALNYEERIKRLQFYERNGFYDLHIQTKEAGVTYELLGTDHTVIQADYLQLMKDYQGSLVHWLVFRETIVQ